MALLTEELVQKKKSKRASRRNFAAEREKVVGFCLISIAVIDSLNGGLTEPETKQQLAGKREAYQNVLKLMGETTGETA